MLKESNIEFDIIQYLKTPLSKQELAEVAKGLKIEPVDLVRAKDKKFKELGLSKDDKRSGDEWLQLIAENPSLMERPIVINGKKMAIGRPPESIKNIL